MKNKTFQQQINDVSPYSQINKAFRYAYGSPAAAVLATLIYKYTYWEQNKGLIPINTVNGNTIKHFHISKLDISVNSDVSFSSLEKDTEYNPLKILEHLKLIKIISIKKANKSDRFVLYPNRIKAEIERVSKLFEEDIIYAEVNYEEVRRARHQARHFLDEDLDMTIRNLKKIQK